MITAVKFVRNMRGRAQSFLMLCNDGYCYVVKFQNNPQHLKVLANEWLGSSLAKELGLSVPPYKIVRVDEPLIESTPELILDFPHHEKRRCIAGLHFGSRFVGGTLPGRETMDYLPEPFLSEVSNLGEFHGALVFDKWTINADGRQAVYNRAAGRKRYKAWFIDHGFCFGFDEPTGTWTAKDAPLRGVFARNAVYKGVTGWDSFEPWLTQVEQISIDTVWRVASTIPEDWHAGDHTALEQMIERLYARRERVREMITEFRNSSRNPFPNWFK